MSVDLILFDLGGPIVRNGPEAGFEPVSIAVARELGVEVTRDALARLLREAVLAYETSPARYMLWQLVKPDRALFDRGLALVWKEWEGQGVPPAREGIGDVLAELSKHYALGLCTNYPVAWQKRYLAAHGLERFFPTLIEGPFRKPDPRALIAALEAHGGEAARTVLVGDRRDNDVRPANEVGMRSIWLRDGLYRDQPARTPEDEPAAAMESIQELPAVLRGLAPAPEAEPPPAGALYRSHGCFGCGTHNHAGLELQSMWDGSEVTATFRPKPAHRGWSKLVHGGILATALDEVVCLAGAQVVDSKVVTVKTEVEYCAPAFMDRVYTVRARPLPSEGKLQAASGEVTDDRGTVVARARLWCVAVSGERATRYLEG